MKQKRISIIVVLALVLSLIPENSIHATSKSSDEAIAWVQSQVGNGIDYDGAYGNQCVDLIMAYCSYLGAPIIYGNAKDYTSSTIPSGWSRHQGASPNKGDILIYLPNNYCSSYGHVAIYESDSVTYHQNYNKQKYVSRLTQSYRSAYFGAYWGVIRPNFSGSSSNSSHTVQILEAKTAGQDDGGYMMYCKVDDESAVRSIQCASWANAGGTAEAKTQDMAHMEQNVYKLYVSYNLFRSEATVFYNDINITSHNGQVTRATMIVNSKKNKNPVIQSVEMAGEDNDGYMVACRVDDDLLVRSIKIATWTDVGTNKKAIFQPMVLMEKNLYKYYVPYKDHDAKSTIYYNDIYITAVNDNEVKYATLVKKRGSGSSGTVTPVSTIKPTTTASPSPKPSSDPKASATPKPSASAKPTASGKPIGTDSPDKTPTPASGDSDHAAVPSPTPVLFGDGVTIQFTKSVYRLDIDETMYLSYSISPEEAPDIDMVWSSSDESIVSVDDDGMVTAHDYGSVLITVKNSSSAATCSVRVTVQPSGTKIKKIKGTKEGFCVRWKKVRDVDGYQISYSTSDGFRKSKSRTIKKSSSYKASDLDRRKKYYVRIRTYVKVEGKMIYSEWTKTKTVRTR